MKRLCVALATSLCLAGCASANREAIRAAPAVVCGTIAAFTRAEQQKIADELDHLPGDSVIGGRVVPDWLRMRDEIRACRKLK